MHIKRVIIHGFKSYNETVVLGPFSPGTNALVGLNGSGKSNFYKAIEFVLLDEYDHIRVNDRKALLHEGQGTAALTAYVEIIFDNKSRQIPIEKDEISIRRAISLQKDEYFVDRKHSTRQDVHNLLEGCGFSPSNGYYIVKQGKVSTLSTMKDSERLDLLLEIAGIRVYFAQREESLRLIAESRDRKKKITDSLAYIENQLNKLESEKAELEEFDKLDRERRAVEYLIQQSSIQENNNEMETRIQEKDMENHTIMTIRDEMGEKSIELKKTEDRLIDIRISEKMCFQERSDIESHDQEMIRSLTRSQLKAEKIERKLQTAEEVRSNKEEKLKQIESEIQMLTQKDQAISEDFDHVDQQKALTEGQLSVLTQLCEVGEIEDPSIVQKDLEKVHKDIKFHQNEYKNMQNEIMKIQKQLDNTEAHRCELNNKLIDIENQEKMSLSMKKEQMDNRKIVWNEQYSKEKELRDVQRQLNKLNTKAERVMSSDVSKAIQFLKEKKMPGVFGSIIDLIQVDQIAAEAAYSIARNKLYYIVVDTESHAKDVTKQMHQNHFNGISIMILDKLPTSYKELPSGVDSLVSHISYDQLFEPAMQFIFGGIAFCQDLRSGNEIVESKKVNVVTSDGDFLSSHGPMTGGSRNHSKSPLLLSSLISKRVQSIQNLESEIQDIALRLSEIENNITIQERTRQSCESERSNILQQISEDLTHITRLRFEIDQMNQRLEEKNIFIHDLEYHKMSLEERLKSIDEMNKKIDKDLIKKLEEYRLKRSSLDHQRLELLQQRMQTRSRLRDVLIPQKRGLQDSMAELDHDRLMRRLNSEQEKMTTYEKKRIEFQSRISRLSSRLSELSSESTVIETKISNLKSEIERLQKKVISHSNHLERILARILLLQQKQEELSLEAQNLGTYPAEEVKAHEQESTSELYRQLHIINDELKVYRFVNKKALEQHNSFTTQRDDLIRRREDLESSEISISELIQALDNRKNESVEHTFAMISDNFAKIFQELVPNGIGYLSLQKDPDADDVPTGIGIRIQFPGHPEPVTLHQLSGGQKSLVALSLIFAIQQYSPAPFYLMDEVDSALDPAYRQSVASLIRRLSSQDEGAGAQFILTSFKEELLQSCDKYFAVKSDRGQTIGKEITENDAIRLVTEKNEQYQE